MLPRLAVYGLASTALFGIVVSSNLKARPNFYSAAVALGRSSGALMVLANFALFNAIWVGVVLKVLFFGRLRSIEYEVRHRVSDVHATGVSELRSTGRSQLTITASVRALVDISYGVSVGLDDLS